MNLQVDFQHVFLFVTKQQSRSVAHHKETFVFGTGGSRHGIFSAVVDPPFFLSKSSSFDWQSTCQEWLDQLGPTVESRTDT